MGAETRRCNQRESYFTRRLFRILHSHHPRFSFPPRGRIPLSASAKRRGVLASCRLKKEMENIYYALIVRDNGNIIMMTKVFSCYQALTISSSTNFETDFLFNKSKFCVTIFFFQHFFKWILWENLLQFLIYIILYLFSISLLTNIKSIYILTHSINQHRNR